MKKENFQKEENVGKANSQKEENNGQANSQKRENNGNDYVNDTGETGENHNDIP